MSRKQGKILPPEYKQKAIANNIPIASVYARLKKGWDLFAAVTIPPKETKVSNRGDNGLFIKGKRPKTVKSYSFKLYVDLEDKFEQAVQDSGKTYSDFILDVIEEFLTNVKNEL